MTRFLTFLTTAILMLALIAGVSAQSDTGSFEITYDETRSRLFSGAVAETFSERWRLLDTSTGDIPVIRVTRISGQLVPAVRLYDSTGELVAESSEDDFTDSAELIYETGLNAENAPYQIEVSATNVIDDVFNPIEYSLSVRLDGRRRLSPDEGLTPLPDVGLLPPPALGTGDSQTSNNFNIPVFGTLQTETSTTLTSTNGQSVTLEPETVASSIGNINLLDAGIGLTIRNENLAINPDRRFFSDESFSVRFNDVSRNYFFTMESGMVIVTTFAQIESIEVREGFAAFRIQSGGETKRLVFDDQSINLRRSSGDTPNYVIELGDNVITTDLALWDTLASFEGNLRLYETSGARFTSPVASMTITGNTATNIQQISLPVIREDNTSGFVDLSIEWTRIHDISITENMVTTITRNGIISEEQLAFLTGVLYEDGAVRYTRIDNTARTVFPDGTDISTRATLAENSDTLPYEAGFRTRNYNNLGEDILPACPCSSDIQVHTPVNPSNGNFFYTVRDFMTEGQSLALNLTRYYNSHDNRYAQGLVVDSRLTPRYMLNAVANYPRFGNGWRHSYQYELDISTVPLGRLTFIEPDGTGHYFSPQQGNSNLWVSRTLLSMRITREDGALGTWWAETTSGLRYDFDRVGRLERISQQNQSITITEMPASYTSEDGQSGIFIVDSYGRRIEMYTNEDGLITSTRNNQSSLINYAYDGQTLTGVEYDQLTQASVATYGYSAVGLLASYDDVRSPYTRTGRIEYYPDNTVQTFIENPNDTGTLSRQFVYIYQEYEPGAAERVTNRIFEVGGERRVQTWTYNNLWQLVNVQLPEDGWEYQFSYDITSGQLQRVRVPTDVNFNLTFDERGNLTRFEDPEFTGDSAYNLTYEQRGFRSLLTQIRYPNNQTDTFTWSDGGDPLLLSHSTLVSVGNERTTRTRQFQYDETGRLVMVVEPDNIATVYRYDSTGYVSRILEGVAITSEDTVATITEDRASSITTLNHNLSGQLQSVIDTRGTAYSIRWNSSGQVSSIQASTGEIISYSYDERGRLTTVNDRGQQSIYTYNSLDLVSDFQNAAGSQQTFEYDEAGNVLTIVNGLGIASNFQYDALDNLTLRRNTNGSITRYETIRDPERNAIIRTETDATGRIISRRYDFLGRLTRYTIFTDIETTTPFQEFRFEYGSGGGRNLTAIVDTLTGRELILTYNIGGDLLSVTVGDFETTFDYNLAGLLAEVVVPGNLRYAYSYDEPGNINAVTLPDNTVWQYGYDGNSNLVQMLDPLGIETIYTYDELNRIESSIDALGQVESFSYNERGNLAAITDPNLNNTTFEYNALDQIAVITDPAGNFKEYEYDLLGRVEIISQTDASPPTRITYDNAGNIIAITEQRQRSLYSYDALGRVISVTDPLGHTTSYTYDTVGAVMQRQDALGNTETYTRAVGTNFLQSYTNDAGNRYLVNSDVLGRPTTIRLDGETINSSDGDPIDTQIIYDDAGHITDIQIGTLSARSSGIGDKLYQYSYSPTGQVIEYIDTQDGVWSLEYDDLGHLTILTNPQGTQTRYFYDDVGRVTAVFNYAGTDVEQVERYEYDANGNITAYEIPDTLRHEYGYNTLNLLSRAQLAVGTEQTASYQFGYNAFQRLEQLITPDGNRTEYVYPFGSPNNLATRRLITPGGLSFTTSYDYDSNNLTSITLEGSDEDINVSYDALDRRVRYVDSVDQSWAYTYDEAGNIAQISDPLGSVVSYAYDVYDRVTSITYPSGTLVNLRYDITGNIASVVSPASGSNTGGIRYQLDEAGQLLSVQAGTNSIQFEYDESGNITRRIAPGDIITIYDYDEAGRLVQTTYNSTGETINYAYDALGNRSQMGTIELGYDQFGRMIQATDGNDSTNYQYSTIGNLEERQSDAFGTTSYTYDSFNRVESINYAGQQINIVYDARGRVDTYQRGALTTSYTYDENDRITQLGHFRVEGDRTARIDVFTYTYDAVGNVTKVERLANGETTEVSYSYDIDQRLISERWLSDEGETFYSVNYRYDEAGNRLEENRNGRITTFTYNAQNQLIREERNLAEGEFLMLPSLIFGLSGLVFVRRRKRLWATIPIITGIFVSITFAQTTPLIAVEYEYDPPGNMTLVRFTGEEIYTLDYDYDNENRLVSVQGQSISFAEDGDEIGVDIDTSYIYDEVSRLVGVQSLSGNYTLYYDGHTLTGMSDGTSTARYISHNGLQLMTITGDDEILWNLHDRQGSSRRFADRDGNLIDDRARQLEFGAFGTRIFPYNEDAIAPPDARINAPSQFYAGQLYDPSTRLYFMGVRAYDPVVGRFLQPDPIRHDPVGTLYTYARNRPLTFYDPTGMIVEPFTTTLDLALTGEDIRPESFVPSADLSPVPVPESVSQQQSDEFFRALQIVASTRFGVNDSVLQLSPLYDDLHLIELNPVPEDMKSVLATGHNHLMSIYDSETGWRPDLTPQPSMTNDPFAVLDDLMPKVAQAYANPLAFTQEQNLRLSLVPTVAIPPGISQQEQIEDQLLDQLQPVQPLPALEGNTGRLLNLIPPNIHPDMSLPTVELPSVEIEPPILSSLDDLREQTYGFYSRIWDLNQPDCSDCVPALGFNQ